MTTGQERALLQLKRLCAARPDDLEITAEPTVEDGWLKAVISIRMGALETHNGGLAFREREEFVLWVPADFPFERPSLQVTHDRFAGFSHVTWSHWICLYRQDADWNPRAGLYGFFEKLRLWLAKAAINDMDPVDAPLEPPHHVTDSSQAPFVIRANAPVPAGTPWIGYAALKTYANRVELAGWTNIGEHWTAGTIPALAVILPHALPLEFPTKGREFFRELEKQAIDRVAVLRYLAFAALLTQDGDEIHIVLGTPMRRSAAGEPRTHVAVWTTSQTFAKALRLTLQEEDDPPTLSDCRAELAEIIYQDIADTKILFCKVFDDRPEIVVARDHGSAASWFAGKRVLILGCGALGSWIGEIVARAGAAKMHLVDNGLVKPGILARQNFSLDDVGSYKARALAARLQTTSASTLVVGTFADAHTFITEDPGRFRDFDVAIDCTASAIFQVKLERDWRQFARATPPMISLGIDADAKHCIGVSVPRGAAGGLWDAYLQLQYRLCVTSSNGTLIEAFYSDRADGRLFQPEPGCSEPTFVGSTADVMALAANAINVLIGRLSSGVPCGVGFSSPSGTSERVTFDVLQLAQLAEVDAGQYRVRVTETVYREARGWVQQNNRLRSSNYETGGLLWGLWDDAAEMIWVFDASGPPADSVHSVERFSCGVAGTLDEHNARLKRTHDLCGFVGMWHTHPHMESQQSHVDVGGMATLVSGIGHNQRRALMLIFGRAHGGSNATFYAYESQGAGAANIELVSIASGVQLLETAVV
jgi:Prokaryotic E2 family A/ThiF family